MKDGSDGSDAGPDPEGIRAGLRDKSRGYIYVNIMPIEAIFVNRPKVI